MSLHPPVWHESFSVRAYEVDPHGRASLPALCNYMQEAAGLHARALGFAREAMMAHNLIWVLARLSVVIHEDPGWGDTLTVETWPSGVERLFAYREYRLLDAQDRLIGLGTSQWLLIDAERRRPARIPPFIQALRVTDRERSIVGPLPRLRAPSEAQTTRRFTVRRSDLDANAHVNNSRYIGYVAESVPAPLQDTHRLCKLDIAFRGEGYQGDVFTATSTPRPTNDGLAFAHGITRDADEKLMVVAQSEWMPLSRVS